VYSEISKNINRFTTKVSLDPGLGRILHWNLSLQSKHERFLFVFRSLFQEVSIIIRNAIQTSICSYGSLLIEALHLLLHCSCLLALFLCFPLAVTPLSGSDLTLETPPTSGIKLIGWTSMSFFPRRHFLQFSRGQRQGRWLKLEKFADYG